MDAARRGVLFDTILAELAEKGYEGLSVAAALGVAGISEAEFQAEFDDVDDCLFTAYDELGERAIALVRNECATAERWPKQVVQGLAALLDKIAEKPELAEMMTLGFPAIRPGAYSRYAVFVSKFAPLMSGGREHSELGDQLPAEVELLAVGSAESLIFAELNAGRADSLPRMLPEILFSLLVPFLGPEQASEEMRGAAEI